MSAERVPHGFVIGTGASGAGQTLATATPIPLGPRGLVSVHVSVDNGTDGVAPTDAPAGALHLYAAAFSKYDLVTAADTDLLAVSPTGSNALIGGWANFENTPGRSIKIVYTRTSGGGTGSRLRIGVVVA